MSARDLLGDLRAAVVAGQRDEALGLLDAVELRQARSAQVGGGAMSDRKCTNPKDVIGSRKVAMSTVPAGVLMEISLGMLEGSVKGYGRHNYRVAGVRSSIYYDAALGHIMDWWEGDDIDAESGLSHITKALSSLVVLRDAMLQDMLTDDRPPRSKVFKRDFNGKAAEIIDRYEGTPVHHYTIADTPAQAAEEPAANDEGWTRWHGCGFPPVEEERMVTVRRRDGIEARGPAVNFVWDLVAAYKVEAA